MKLFNIFGVNKLVALIPIFVFQFSLVSCEGISSTGGVKAGNPGFLVISSTNPKDNSTGISIGTDITTTFSSKLDLDEIENATITLNSNAVSYTLNNNKVIINPNADLDESSTYIVKVSNVTDVFGNKYSDDYSFSFTTQVAGGSSDNIAPSAPGSLKLVNGVTNPTSSSVSLEWSESSDNVAVTGYRIIRNSVQLATTASNRFVDGLVDSGTTYSYSVEAFDAVGNLSSPSNSISATTLTSSIDVASDTIYYVAMTNNGGNDSNDGLTISTPFATLSKAVSVVEPGDIIEMRTGTYAGANISRPGTATNWITLRPYKGENNVNEEVIIDGSMGGRAETLYFYHSSCDPGSSNYSYVEPNGVGPNGEDGSCLKMYWVVDGLDITGGSVYAVQIDTPFVKLINNKIHDSARDNVKVVKSANDTVIFGNEIYKSAPLTVATNAQGIDIVGADRVWVANNFIHDISSIGMYAKGNARNTIFENNLVVNILDSGIQLGQSTDAARLFDGEFESYDGIIRNNVIIKTFGPCLQTSSSTNVKIYNNSCYDVAINSHGGIRLANESEVSRTGQNIEIKNNIVVVRSNTSPKVTRPVVKVSGNALTDFSTLDIDNNLYWTTGGSAAVTFSWKDSTLASLSNWQTVASQGSASVVGDPLFSDPTNNDLSISSSSSPAVNTGLATSVVSLDYNGAARPSTGVDKGAFERGAELPASGAREMPTKAGQSLLFRYPFLQTATAKSMKILWGVSEPGHGMIYVRNMQTNKLIVKSVNIIERVNEVEVDKFTAGVIHNTNFYQNLIKLDGLVPNTEYKYDIIHNGQAIAKNVSFKTIPASGSNTVNVVVIGDNGTQFSQPRNVRDEIIKPSGNGLQYPHDFIIGVGDIAYNDGVYYEFDRNFFDQLSGKNDNKPEKSILSGRPFYASLGNHEYANNILSLPEAFLSSFSLPIAANIPDEDQERYFSFDSGSAHFVVLDSMKFTGNPATEETVRLQQMLDWLDADLAASTKPWKLVFFHHTIFSNGPHGTEGDRAENRSMREKLVPIFQKRGVRLVMFGHDHMYQRSVPFKLDANSQIIRNSNGEIDTNSGIVYILSGHGGKDLHNVRSNAFPTTYNSTEWLAQQSAWGVGYDFAARDGVNAPRSVIYHRDSPVEDVPNGMLHGFTHLEITPLQIRVTAYLYDSTKIDDTVILQ